MVIGPRHDHVGAEIGGARQQGIADRDGGVQAFFALRLNPVSPQMADDALERGPAAIEVGLLDGEWHMLDRSDLAELIQLAKAADLTILGQYPGSDSGGATWLRPDDVMVDSGRPVLVVPYAGGVERVGRRVLIAWNGTREANRALHDALPLIDGAEAVTSCMSGRKMARPELGTFTHRLLWESSPLRNVVPPPRCSRNSKSAMLPSWRFLVCP
jgi:hypothetical protein